MAESKVKRGEGNIKEIRIVYENGTEVFSGEINIPPPNFTPNNDDGDGDEEEEDKKKRLSKQTVSMETLANGAEKAAQAEAEAKTLAAKNAADAAETGNKAAVGDANESIKAVQKVAGDMVEEGIPKVINSIVAKKKKKKKTEEDADAAETGNKAAVGDANSEVKPDTNTEADVTPGDGGGGGGVANERIEAEEKQGGEIAEGVVTNAAEEEERQRKAAEKEATELAEKEEEEKEERERVAAEEKAAEDTKEKRSTLRKMKKGIGKGISKGVGKASNSIGSFFKGLTQRKKSEVGSEDGAANTTVGGKKSRKPKSKRIRVRKTRRRKH